MAGRINGARRIQADPTYVAHCATCGAYKKFYTAQGVSGFRFEHSGHEITVQDPVETTATKAESGRFAPRQAQRDYDISEVSGMKAPSAVDLERLYVRVGTSGSDDPVHFELEGSASEDGFSVVFPLTNARELRDLIHAGSYVLPRKGRSQEFRWKEDCVQADGQACQLLGIQSESVATGSEVKTETVEPGPAGTQQDALTQAEEPVAALAPSVASSLGPSEERETLLIANSFYLKDGEEVQEEAMRISRALKELRWGVKPPYLISVMMDDSVGIEANGDAIMADLVDKIESLEYRFVAMNSPNGTPTAWFKKRKDEERSVLKPEGRPPRSVEGMVSLMESLVSELETERAETSKMAREGAARDERLSDLFKQLREVASSAQAKTEIAADQASSGPAAES